MTPPYLGDFPVSGSVFLPFATYDVTDGSSATLTGLAVTGIEVYRDGSTVQRASDSGYSLLDTDGIDFDGTTGLHGISIDLSDDDDPGFFAAGHEYMVAVAGLTVDAAAVSYWLGTFTIERADGTLARLAAVQATQATAAATLANHTTRLQNILTKVNSLISRWDDQALPIVLAETSRKALVVFSETDTGVTIDGVSFGYCYDIITGEAVATTGCTLAEVGNGAYVLYNPNVVNHTVFRVELNLDAEKFSEGAWAPYRVGNGYALQDTLLEVKAKTDLIQPAGSTTGWSNPESSPVAGGPTLVKDLFTEVRTMISDPGEKLYPPPLMIAYYNRILTEINPILMGLSAECAMRIGTITTDGTNISYVLPGDFLAMVPGQFLPRSPIDALADYTHGRPLEQIDRLLPSNYSSPTRTATPSGFYLTASGSAQSLVFDCLPPADQIYDCLYYSVPVRLTLATLETATIPWLGLLDGLVARCLEEFCREGKEFTTEKRSAWRARTEGDVRTILGLRHLQTNVINPSIWRGI